MSDLPPSSIFNKIYFFSCEVQQRIHTRWSLNTAIQLDKYSAFVAVNRCDWKCVTIFCTWSELSRQISGWWDQCVQILRFRAEVALFASLFALNLAWQIAHSAKTGASGSLDFPYFYVPTRISPLGTSAFWEFFLNFTEVYFFWKCQKNRAITSSVFLRDYEGSKKNNFLPFLIFLTKLLVTGWPNFTQFLTSVLPTNLIL